MEYVLKLLLGLFTLAVAFALAAWIGWHFLKKSDDPGRLLFKWIVTGVVLGLVVASALSLRGAGFGGAFAVPILGLVFGVFLGILWAPNLGALIAKPFTSLYDDGGVPPEVRPFYSIAQANRKRGRYPEAIAHVRSQLQKFPEDYEGWMLLAEIYGDDLKDNAGAQSCIEEILRQEGHASRNIAFALNRSSDWHLSLATDREAAKASLVRITEVLPDTEFAQLAWQRIAHLASDRMLADQKDRRKLLLTRHEGYVGLQTGKIELKAPVEDFAGSATKLVEHLNEHPFDMEAREQLAVIYADHYQRLDLAVDQLEELISSPNPLPKHVARWLNALADLHIRIAGDRDAANAALKRIIERFPGSAAAANAEKRIAYLDLELNSKKESQPVPLGSYAQNIGLQGQLPKRL